MYAAVYVVPALALLKLVILSDALKPVSFDGSRSGVTGVVERLVEFTSKKFSTAAITALRLALVVMVSKGKPMKTIRC